MNILLLAYACEPNAGSEYGVGWMVPLTMAKLHPEDEVFVLTRSRCKDKIDRTLRELSCQNLHFLFYDIPHWMFYKNEMESNWGEQINYILWQLLVRRYIKKDNKKFHFDVIHHLTFNQYRTPSPGFFLDIPFIMGPVGGAECISPAFYQDLEYTTLKKEEIRLKGQDLKIFGWMCRWKNNRKHILFSSMQNIKRLSPYCGNARTDFLPAIAFDKSDFAIEKDNHTKDDCFEMVYAGKALDWKGIHIFLKSVKRAFVDSCKKDFVVKLIGIRFKEEQEKVIGWINEYGLENHVELIPFIERPSLLRMLTTCNLSVYPAFRDSGSMSVLEASALGCPTICFNAGGQDVFPDNILLKMDVKDTYDENTEEFAKQLAWAYDNRQELQNVGMKAKKWVEDNLTWDSKVELFHKYYLEVING